MDESQEHLVIVDENDRPVGTERRGVVHEKGLRHRSVHVLVFNGAGELLVQQRSSSKDSYPLFWDVSVGGHVGAGETYRQAAEREIVEEIGIGGDLEFLRKTAASEATDWEFTCLYRMVSDKPVRPNRTEIVRCEFVAPGRLLAEIRSGTRRATPALLSALLFYLGREVVTGGSKSPEE